MVISVELDGKLTYMNPTAERLLGYHAAELVDKESTDKLLAPGEEDRLVSRCGALRDQQTGGRRAGGYSGDLRRGRAFARPQPGPQL